MHSVTAALHAVLDSIGPLGTQTLPLHACPGRVLARSMVANTTHPPCDVSAMDGYAVRARDVTTTPCTLPLAGVCFAGQESPTMDPGQAVRIFTGGVMPTGADAVVIQENAEHSGDTVTIRKGVDAGTFVRPAGLDFQQGDALLTQGQVLTPRALALAAAMNHADLPVYRQPLVAIISTGDEIKPPGSSLAPREIPASNSFGLAAFIQTAGGVARDVGIVRDHERTLRDVIADLRDVDLLVTSGGASVGERDLTGQALDRVGMKTIVSRVAMRPGKPLRFGMIESLPVLVLPGNPVSALVCAHVFLGPVLDRLSGHSRSRHKTVTASLAHDLPAAGARQDYLRTRLKPVKNGYVATPFAHQDSAMLSVLAQADGLLIRAPKAPPLAAGAPVEVLTFDRL